MSNETQCLSCHYIGEPIVTRNKVNHELILMLFASIVLISFIFSFLHAASGFYIFLVFSFILFGIAASLVLIQLGLMLLFTINKNTLSCFKCKTKIRE